jgi:hypothetical protein
MTTWKAKRSLATHIVRKTVVRISHEHVMDLVWAADKLERHNSTPESRRSVYTSNG